jgi:hypothetical protein
VNTDSDRRRKKDPSSRRALLRQRMGVLDGREKRFKEAKKDEETVDWVFAV